MDKTNVDELCQEESMKTVTMPNVVYASYQWQKSLEWWVQLERAGEHSTVESEWVRAERIERIDR